MHFKAGAMSMHFALCGCVRECHKSETAKGKKGPWPKVLTVYVDKDWESKEAKSNGAD